MIFMPKLFTNENNDLFVQVDFEEKLGHYSWQKVEKVALGFYKKIETPFFDLQSNYTTV